MITKQTKNARLVEWIKVQQNEAQRSIRQFYEPEWKILLTAYMNYDTTEMPPGAEWVDDRVIADAYRFISSATPGQILAKYQNPKFYNVVTPTVPGDSLKMGIRAFIDTEIRNSKYIERSVPAYTMLRILGHAIQKTIWVDTWGKKQVRVPHVTLNQFGEPVMQDRLEWRDELLFHGSWVEWPDLMDVWKSPAVDMFGNHLWWIHSMDTTLQELNWTQKEWQKEGGLYDDDVLREVNKKKSIASPTGTSRTVTPFEIAGFGEGGPYDQNNLQDFSSLITKAQRRTPENVVKWEFIGFVPPDIHQYPEEEGQWRLLEMANATHILRDDVAPIPAQKASELPFNDIYANRVGHEAYGRSDLRWTLPEIEQRSRLRNLRLADAFARLFPPAIYDMSADWEDYDFTKYPAGRRGVDANGEGVAKYFQQVQYPPVNQSLYMEDQLLENHSQLTMGTPEAFQGGFTTKRMQATEFEGTVRLGSARHQLSVFMSDLQGTHEYIQRAFKLAQLYLREPRRIQLEDGEQGLMTFSMLQENVDFYMDGGQFGNLDANKIQAISNFVLPMMQDPEFRAKNDVDQIFDDMMYWLGFSRGNQYKKTEAQIREEQAQAMAQMQAMEAAQAAGGAGPQGQPGPGTAGPVPATGAPAAP